MTDTTSSLSPGSHATAATIPAPCQHAPGAPIPTASTLAERTGSSALRLDNRFAALYEAMPLLGQVTVTTGNHAARIRRSGQFNKLGREGEVGLALGPIDLRIFYSRWATGFAVRATQDGIPAGFYFFDANGQAITSVILEEASDRQAFETLLDQHTAQVAQPGSAPVLATSRPQTPETSDNAEDIETFRAAWDTMTDPHEFFGLLRRFGFSRIQAMRLARPDQARELAADTYQAMFAEVVASGLPIMAFIGNSGQIQIHTGPISELTVKAGQLIACAPDLTLTLDTTQIAGTWAVHKPSPDGTVTSLEVYDAAGDNIAMFFGARKPGRPELEDWRATVARLEADAARPASTI